MKVKYLLPVLILFFLIINTNLLSQPEINNYYNYNDVFSIAIDETNSEIWLGTKSGVVVRDLNGNLLDTLTKDKGLSSNYIISIAIDNAENKWFGSFDNGITMYDGANFTIYNPANSNMSRQVNSITVESSGEVWFASPDGVRMFDGSNFTHYATDDASNAIIGVSSIYAEGNFIYIAAESGLFLFDVTDNTWTMYSKINMNIAATSITSVVAIGSEIYVGTNGAGIAYFDGASWQTPQAPGNNIINYLYVHPANSEITAATQNGAYYYQDASWVPWFASWISTDFKVFAIDNTGGGWAGFGLNGKGVDFSSDYGATSATNFSEPEELSKSDINDIEINPVNNDVLIATEGGGISIFDGTNWMTEKFGAGIPSDIVRDISIIETGEYWCATDAGVGLYGGNWIIFNSDGSLPSNDIKAIEAVSGSNAWVGTDVGASYYNASWANYTFADGMLVGPVISITIDKNANVWCLHINGVSVFNGSAWSQYTRTNMNLAADAILTEIDNDINGGVWIASTSGAARYNGTAWDAAFTTSNSDMASDDLVSVFVDNANVKHFGSKDGFILIYNDTHWGKIGIEKGLATSFISAVCYDDSRSSIWSGGPWGGLSQSAIAPLELTAFAIPASICQGDFSTLHAEATGGFGNFVYEWRSEPAGPTLSNATETVSPDVDTKYFITVYDDFESIPTQVDLIVKSVTPSTIEGPTDVCFDGSAQPYSVQADALKDYLWEIEGGSITTGQNTEQIHVIWNEGIDLGKIILTEFDENIQCDSTHSKDINIHASLSAEVLRKGDNLLISTDSGMVRYQWFRNELAIEGATQQFYSVPTGTNRGGTYHLEIESELNCFAVSESILIGSPTLKLYPNPAESIINLEFTSIETGNGIIEIKDLSGKTVLSKTFNKTTSTQKLDLNLPGLLPGIYNIDIYLNNRFLYSEKVVKN